MPRYLVRVVRTTVVWVPAKTKVGAHLKAMQIARGEASPESVEDLIRNSYTIDAQAESENKE